MQFCKTIIAQATHEAGVQKSWISKYSMDGLLYSCKTDLKSEPTIQHFKYEVTADRSNTVI